MHVLPPSACHFSVSLALCVNREKQEGVGEWTFVTVLSGAFYFKIDSGTDESWG